MFGQSLLKFSQFTCRLSWNPASLFFKEVSVHGMYLSGAPKEELAKAFEAVSAGTAKDGWVCNKQVLFSLLGLEILYSIVNMSLK